MQSNTIYLTLTTILLAAHAQAATPIDGWYASGFGGFAYVPNNIYTRHGGALRDNTGYQTGFDAGGSLGFKSNPMRYEGEVTYVQVNVDHFDVNGIRQTQPSGYNQGIFGLANVYYDFPSLICTLQPFLGGGLGYGWVQVRLESEGPLGITKYVNGNSAFAYQGTAGIVYNFAENAALSIGYRYLATTNVNALGNSFQTHMGNLGAIYRFDESNYK